MNTYRSISAKAWLACSIVVGGCVAGPLQQAKDALALGIGKSEEALLEGEDKPLTQVGASYTDCYQRTDKPEGTVLRCTLLSTAQERDARELHQMVDFTVQGGAVASYVVVPPPTCRDVSALAWNPKRSPDLKPLDRTWLYSQRIRLVLFDHREEPRTVYASSSGHRFCTWMNVGQWVLNGFSSTLKQYGLTVTKEDPTVRLVLDLREASARQRNAYAADLVAKVAAYRPGSEKPFWLGLAKGSGATWGRSFSPDNHQLVLSTSVVDAVRNLLEDPGFLDALRPPVAPPPPLPPPPPPPPPMAPAP